MWEVQQQEGVEGGERVGGTGSHLVQCLRAFSPACHCICKSVYMLLLPTCGLGAIETTYRMVRFIIILNKKTTAIPVRVFTLALNTSSVESPLAVKSPNCSSVPLGSPAEHSRSSLGGQ